MHALAVLLGIFVGRNYFGILRNPFTGRGRKVAMTALMLGSWAYALIASAYYKKQRRLVG